MFDFLFHILDVCYNTTLAAPPTSEYFSNWFPPIVGFLGTVVTIATIVYLQRKRYLLDCKDRAAEQIRSHVFEVADVSSRYWLKNFKDAESSQSLESLISGRVYAINMQLGLFKNKFGSKKLNSLGDEELSNFIDSVTGGNFMTSKRKVDLVAANKVQMHAVKLLQCILNI